MISEKLPVIGKLTLPNCLIMAPMAGITDVPFRHLAKEGGAGLVCTEMVSANALVHGDPKSRKLMKLSRDEHPVSIQIFGSVPSAMAEAARMAEAEGADIIDINMGCPVKKVMKAGAGVKLLDNESNLRDILDAVVGAVKVPVTLKTRVGRVPSENLASEVVRIAEQSGIAMTAVHGRPASQGHSGLPDINAVKEAVASASKMPVAANGGIVDEDTAKEYVDVTGCSLLMIGRAAIGDPYLFARIDHFLKTGEKMDVPSWEKKFEMLKRHAAMSADYYGERFGLIILRKVAPFYLKGMPNASRIRNEFNKITKLSELDELSGKVWDSSYFGQEEDGFGEFGRDEI